MSEKGNVHYLAPQTPSVIAPVEDEIRQAVLHTLDTARELDLSNIVIVGVPRNGGDLSILWSEEDDLAGVALVLNAAQVVIAKTFLQQLMKVGS